MMMTPLFGNPILAVTMNPNSVIVSLKMKTAEVIITVAKGVALAMAKAMDQQMGKGLMTMHLKLMVRVFPTPLFVS